MIKNIWNTRFNQSQQRRIVIYNMLLKIECKINWERVGEEDTVIFIVVRSNSTYIHFPKRLLGFRLKNLLWLFPRMRVEPLPCSFFGFKSKPDPFHGLGSNRYNILEILNHTLKLSKKSRCTNLNSQYSILTIQWKYLSRIRWKERNLKAWRESNNGDLFQFLRIVKL